MNNSVNFPFRAGWQVGAGERSGFKNVTAFFPEQNPNSSGTYATHASFHLPTTNPPYIPLEIHEFLLHSSVSVVITGIGPDFTSLKSFGNVDEFAENLVPTCLQNLQ